MANAAGPSDQAGRTSRRVFAIWIVILALIGTVGVTVVLAIGGRPDPVELRAVAPLLGGKIEQPHHGVILLPQQPPIAKQVGISPRRRSRPPA